MAAPSPRARSAPRVGRAPWPARGLEGRAGFRSGQALASPAEERARPDLAWAEASRVRRPTGAWASGAEAWGPACGQPPVPAERLLVAGVEARGARRKRGAEGARAEVSLVRRPQAGQRPEGRRHGRRGARPAASLASPAAWAASAPDWEGALGIESHGCRHCPEELPPEREAGASAWRAPPPHPRRRRSPRRRRPRLRQPAPPAMGRARARRAAPPCARSRPWPVPAAPRLPVPRWKEGAAVLRARHSRKGCRVPKAPGAPPRA